MSKVCIHSRASLSFPPRLLTFRLPITQCLDEYSHKVSSISGVCSPEPLAELESSNREVDVSKKESLNCGRLQARHNHYFAESCSLLRAAFASPEHLAWKQESQFPQTMAAWLLLTVLSQIEQFGFFSIVPGLISKS